MFWRKVSWCRRSVLGDDVIVVDASEGKKSGDNSMVRIKTVDES